MYYVDGNAVTLSVLCCYHIQMSLDLVSNKNIENAGTIAANGLDSAN